MHIIKFNKEMAMLDVSRIFCTNRNCYDYGLKDKGNINVHFAYGIAKNRHMLYCSTCKTRFSETKCTVFFRSKYTKETISQIVQKGSEGLGVRATARNLGLDKNAVNHVFLKAGEHCEQVLDNLLSDLVLTELQLDELWSFIQKNTRHKMRKTKGQYGFGQQLTPKLGF